MWQSREPTDRVELRTILLSGVQHAIGNPSVRADYGKIAPWKKVWGILATSQRRDVVKLFGLMLVGMLLETVGVGMVVPTLAFMANDDPASISPRLSELLRTLGNPPRERLIVWGLTALVALAICKAAFMVFLAWRQSRFMAGLMSSMSQRLFSTYMSQPWTFYLQRNSSELCRNVISEVNVFGNALSARLGFCADALMLAGIGAVLLFIQPVGAVIVSLVLAASTYLFQRATQPAVARWGQLRQEHEGRKIQHLLQGLNGIKDIRILGREQRFVQLFGEHFAAFSHVLQRQTLVNQLPRLWYELIAVVGLSSLAITMLLLKTPTSVFIPTIGLFAVAAFRMLPSINRLVLNAQSLRFTQPGVDLIAEELALLPVTIPPAHGRRAPFAHELRLHNVSFRYPQAAQNAVQNISLAIPRGTAVALIGESGAGKSTLVDLILGLLQPSEGLITLDGANLQDDLRSWQNLIGYVPQSIYLSDDTLQRNIAFGCSDDEVNQQAMWRALQAAQLADFVRTLPRGLETFVGERGIRLSGGQRQRIGIARALYHDPEVLVLDEATSALDTETERGVMECVNSLHGVKTLVIVAHRLSTVAGCDLLYRLQAGAVVDVGSFEELTHGELPTGHPAPSRAEP